MKNNWDIVAPSAGLLATMTMALAGAVPAQANPVDLTSESILFQSRPGTDMSFANALDYVTNWNSLPTSTPGYGNATIGVWNYTPSYVTPSVPFVNNQTLIVGGVQNHLAEHFQVNFNLSAAANVAFRIGPDFGFGGAAFLDNVAVAYNPTDMWWNLSFYFASQTFLFSEVLSAGNHTLDVYGQEDCCSGPTAGQYSINGGAFTPFVTATPLPAALPLLATGLGFLGFLAHRRRITSHVR